MSAIAFDSVTVALGGRRILADVSLAIEPGEFVGVLGPNGAGKTTMFRAILGLLPLAAGRIAVLGQAPRRGNPAIGYVPQSRRAAAQLNIVGTEFLLSAHRGERWGLPFASAADRAAVDAALERVGATALARRPLSELSGGERQRLFVAQALVGHPKLLLLDEPLISLDPAHQRAIVELVRDIARERNIAVLFSAHEVNPLLRAVDKVLYLGGGKAAIGTVDDVVNEAVLSELYRTSVRVIRAEGRIFVIAEDGALDGHEHDHDHDHDHHEEA
ncbi:MAG TPA: ABC transporter ATP-binding protein [Devosia sp.]|nr:ABC transporter ATP-binding protein [Devosia sp.]